MSAYRMPPCLESPHPLPRVPWWNYMLCSISHKRTRTLLYQGPTGEWARSFDGRFKRADWLEVCPRCKHVISYWTCQGEVIISVVRDLPQFEYIAELYEYLVFNDVVINFYKGTVSSLRTGGSR